MTRLNPAHALLGTPLRRAALATVLVGVLALASAVLPLSVQAQNNTTRGSGNTLTEMRTLDSFEAISVSGAMDLVVRQGAQQSVQVQADDKLLPLLETVVENGRNGATLQVRWKRNAGGSWWGGNKLQAGSKVLVTVVVPKLSAVGVAGSGDVRVENFQSPTFQLSLSGSGDARLDGLTTDELGVRVSGSGDVSGRGKAGTVKISIAGSGDVRLSELRADEVSVSIAGSGDAAVNAQKALSVSIAGSGDVRYSGDAQVKSSIAGSGTVRKL